MRFIVSLLVSSLASTALAQPSPPSLDCRKASAPDERAICRDPRLAEMDQAVSIAYAQVPAAEQEAARHDSQANLAARHACGRNRLCILDQQVNALRIYDSHGSTIPVPLWTGQYRAELFDTVKRTVGRVLPTRVGQCATTRIVAISDRFGGPVQSGLSGSPTEDSGVAVQFANGGSQVSYGHDAAVAASAIGDPALVCLVSLPKDCPKGDDRGKVYSTTNLRTKRSWVMPDAQHSCGGA